jgi:signal transduction histidine kinase
MDQPASVLPWGLRVNPAPSIERSRNDFIADASHELKSPVSSILALATTLRTALNDDPVAARRFAQQLEREAERLAKLASDLLDLSRLDRGTAERTAVRLDQILRAEAEILRPVAAGCGLRLRVEAEDRLWVVGSATDLGILIRNLIDNAIRYTPEGGAIEVTARQLDGWSELKVRDTGTGIAADELDRIFDRFYRVTVSGSGRSAGSGLGLAIVRSVAEALGGRVEAQSAVGHGSEFTVQLPVLQDRPTSTGGGPRLRRLDSRFELDRGTSAPLASRR